MTILMLSAIIMEKDTNVEITMMRITTVANELFEQLKRCKGRAEKQHKCQTSR